MTITPAPIDPPSIHPTLWAGIDGVCGWDVGSNVGQSLSEMTTRFEQVIAFEPAAECQPYLAPWRERGVTVLDIAVSDINGPLNLAALPDKIDTGQLVTPGTHGMEWDPEIPEAVRRTVPARSIDSLVEEHPPPDFLKVDVEGHELRVLYGAEQTITDYMPDWLIEFHTPQLWEACVECLKAHGYQVSTIRHPHYAKDSPMWFQHGWLRAHRK